jgi:hypothetical protein|tara:strand:+ start:419 stop:544 length:126 start_codon:yes stop_codon:yes gene_type:complete
MKLPIKIIEDMTKKYKDDTELGRVIRWYIKWLREGSEKKDV